MVLNSCSASCGVSTDVGSSSISNFGVSNSALRISIRWRSPADSSNTSRDGSTDSPNRSARLSICASSALPCTAPSILKAMFSATESPSNSAKCWCTMPMPIARATFGLRISTAEPCHKSSPSSGCCSPQMIFIKVDLPAPFSPSKA